MLPIDFYQLPRDAQERFVGSVDGTGLPAPILKKHSVPLEPVVWLGASIVGFVLFIIVLSTGYGNVESSMGRAGLGWLIVDVGLTGFATFALLRAFVRFREFRASPFRHGIYVFPVGLIDARKEVLGHYAIEDLTGVVDSNPRSVTLSFGSRSFTFPVRDAGAAVGVKAALTGAQSAMGDAGAARESVRPTALAALDPLRGYASPFSPSSPMLRARVEWGRIAWVFAAMTGLVLGGSLWAARNARSDEAMYTHAVEANDVTTYRAYLEHGLRHTTEVSSILLPRALLSEATKIGTVDAIEEFIKDHPRSPIGAEATAALKGALLGELDVAARAGTLAALDDFARRHPQAHVDAELAAARHRVYQAAYERFLATVADKTSPGAVFVQRLLAWAEVKGPRVEVRFHVRRSKSLDKADSAARKSRQYKGVVSTPSRYFDDATQKPDVDGLVAAVAAQFTSLFPPEILAVSAGAPLLDPDAPLPADITTPTLFIEESATWAGSMQASQKPPHGVFAGLELTFDAQFRVPDDTKPLKTRVTGWRLPDLAGARDSETPEQTIYAAMRAKAFDQFEKKLLATIFPAK